MHLEGRVAILITAGCWLALDLYWMLSARHVKRTIAHGQASWKRRIYLALLLLGFALYYLPLSGLPVLGWRIISQTSGWAALGVALCLGGAAFAIWARHVLGSNWSGAVTLKEEHTLIRGGPFAVVRHPIYLGLLVAMVGTTIVVGEIRAFLPLLNILGIWKKIQAEEALLRAAFPQDYPSYAWRVKRLLPWIW